jgi:hypothetical protein
LTPASASFFAQLATECEPEGLIPANAERIGRELAFAFGVGEDEIGILRIEDRHLVFCYPARLHDVARIPLNTSTAVAARTANTRRAEIINNFALIKHTTLFETVPLTPHKASPQAENAERRPRLIQKLMSAPVIGPLGSLGVIQVSRKGESPASAGPDFAQADLQKLVACAADLAKCFK